MHHHIDNLTDDTCICRSFRAIKNHNFYNHFFVFLVVPYFLTLHRQQQHNNKAPCKYETYSSRANLQIKSKWYINGKWYCTYHHIITTKEHYTTISSYHTLYDMIVVQSHIITYIRCCPLYPPSLPSPYYYHHHHHNILFKYMEQHTILWC